MRDILWIPLASSRLFLNFTIEPYTSSNLWIILTLIIRRDRRNTWNYSTTLFALCWIFLFTSLKYTHVYVILIQCTYKIKEDEREPFTLKSMCYIRIQTQPLTSICQLLLSQPNDELDKTYQVPILLLK